jgi:hypothetical protein
VSLNIKDVPNNSGGFFKPEPVKEAVAFLVEVKEWEAQRATTHGPKDSALVDVTTFATQADLDAGEPSAVQTGCRVEQTVLSRDLKGLVGAATIVRLDQTKPTKAGQKPAWVWRPVEAPIKKAVIAYAEKREAEIQAALDSAPSFD